MDTNQPEACAELCDALDAATMQILAIAKLARHAVDSDVPDVLDTIGHALDSIIGLAGEANTAIDDALVEAERARNHLNREAAHTGQVDR